MVSGGGGAGGAVIVCGTLSGGIVGLCGGAGVRGTRGSTREASVCDEPEVWAVGVDEEKGEEGSAGDVEVPIEEGVYQLMFLGAGC